MSEKKSVGLDISTAAKTSLKKGSSSKWPQIIAAFSATLGSFGCGTALAWTAPALPYIDQDQCDDNCDISNVSKEEGSWIGALMPIGALIAGPVTGFLLAKVGRKWTMISYSVPFAIGYILFVMAYEIDDFISIYFGRVLTGFAGGAFALAAPLYIVEIAEPNLRGALASLMQLMSTLGVAFVDVLSIEDAVHWNIISAICIVIPVLLVVAMFFMPESPYYLLLGKKEPEALKSLQWFRGQSHDCSEELQGLKETVEKQREIGSISLKQLFTEAVYLKPFLIAMSLMFLQQFSGVNVVIFYAQTIFRDAGSDIDPGLCSFIVAAAQVFGTSIAVLVVDKFGRKILLILSDLFMSISILCLGVFFYLKEHSTITCPPTTVTPIPGHLFRDDCDPQEGHYSEDLIKSLGWLPLVSLIIYIIMFSIGFGPLPWTVNAEIFSAEAKSLCSSAAFCFNWFCAFLVTKFEPNLEEVIGASGAYFLFAAICALGTVHIVFLVPETKGKSQEELKRMFLKE